MFDLYWVIYKEVLGLFFFPTLETRKNMRVLKRRKGFSEGPPNHILKEWAVLGFLLSFFWRSFECQEIRLDVSFCGKSNIIMGMLMF